MAVFVFSLLLLCSYIIAVRDRVQYDKALNDLFRFRGLKGVGPDLHIRGLVEMSWLIENYGEGVDLVRPAARTGRAVALELLLRDRAPDMGLLKLALESGQYHVVKLLARDRRLRSVLDQLPSIAHWQGGQEWLDASLQADNVSLFDCVVEVLRFKISVDKVVQGATENLSFKVLGHFVKKFPRLLTGPVLKSLPSAVTVVPGTPENRRDPYYFIFDRMPTEDPARSTLLARSVDPIRLFWGHVHEDPDLRVHTALGSTYSDLIRQGGLMFGFRDGLHVLHLDQPDQGWRTIVTIKRPYFRTYALGPPDAEGLVPVYLLGQHSSYSPDHRLRKFLYNFATLTATEVEDFAPNLRVEIRHGGPVSMSVDEVSRTLTVVRDNGLVKPMVFDLGTGAAVVQDSSAINIKRVKLVGKYMVILDSRDQLLRFQQVDGIWTAVPGLEGLLFSHKGVQWLRFDLKYDGELVLAMHYRHSVYFVSYKMP